MRHRSWLTLAAQVLVLLPVRALPASSEDYQVYRAYLSSPFAEKADFSIYDKVGIYFIYNVDPEKPDNISGFFKQYARIALDPELVRQFVASNRTRLPFDRRQFPASTKYSPQYIKQDVYSLSRVGFNRHKDEALLYASYSSLVEDGHGSLIYLKKDAGAWTVAKVAAVWMYGASVHPFNP